MNLKNSMILANMMSQKPKIMYATIKGTLTENDGVFSGFSTSNYLEVQGLYDFSQPFEVCLKMRLTGSPNASGFFRAAGSNLGSFGCLVGAGHNIGVWSRDSEDNYIMNGVYTPNNSFLENTDYWVKMCFTGTQYIIYLSTDNINFTKYTLISSSKNIGINKTIKIGVTAGTQYFNGSIDINNSYIKLGSTKYKLQAVVGYTIVGSPTIVDGVVSGFSTSNYLLLGANVPYSNNFEMVFKITTGSSFSSTNTIFEGSSSNNGLSIAINTSKYLYVSAGNGSWIVNTSGTTVLSANTTYYVKFSCKNNVYKLELSTDNVNWNTEISVESSSVLVTTSAKSIGYSTRFSGRVFRGSIDMNETYIKINNKLWFNGQQA